MRGSGPIYWELMTGNWCTSWHCSRKCMGKGVCRSSLCKRHDYAMVKAYLIFKFEYHWLRFFLNRVILSKTNFWNTNLLSLALLSFQHEIIERADYPSDTQYCQYFQFLSTKCTTGLLINHWNTWQHWKKNEDFC